MDRSRLHQLRLIAPGIMLGVLGISLLHPDNQFIEVFKAIDFSGLGMAGLIGVSGGALYNIFDARSWLTDFSWQAVQSNIKDRLLQAVRNVRPLSLLEQEFLNQDRRLLDLFYRLIDNDESLKSRQDGVRFNGVLATSAADLAAVGAIGWGLHAIMALATHSMPHAIWSTGCFVVWVLAQAVLIPLVLRKHIQLSNEQLDYIATHLSADLREYTVEVLSRMS